MRDHNTQNTCKSKAIFSFEKLLSLVPGNSDKEKQTFIAKEAGLKVSDVVAARKPNGPGANPAVLGRLRVLHETLSQRDRDSANPCDKSNSTSAEKKASEAEPDETSARKVESKASKTSEQEGRKVKDKAFGNLNRIPDHFPQDVLMAKVWGLRDGKAPVTFQEVEGGWVKNSKGGPIKHCAMTFDEAYEMAIMLDRPHLCFHAREESGIFIVDYDLPLDQDCPELQALKSFGVPIEKSLSGNGHAFVRREPGVPVPNISEGDAKIGIKAGNLRAEDPNSNGTMGIMVAVTGDLINAETAEFKTCAEIIEWVKSLHPEKTRSQAKTASGLHESQINAERVYEDLSLDLAMVADEPDVKSMLEDDTLAVDRSSRRVPILRLLWEKYGLNMDDAVAVVFQTASENSVLRDWIDLDHSGHHRDPADAVRQLARAYIEVVETPSPSFQKEEDRSSAQSDFGKFKDETLGKSGEKPGKILKTMDPALLGTVSLDQLWLVRELLPRHGIAVAYGATGVGKTTVLSDVILHIAHGIDWRGLKTERTGVLLVEMEGGDHGIQNSFNGWHIHNKKDQTDINPDWFTVAGEYVNIFVDTDSTEKIIGLCHQRRKAGYPVGVIMLDTQSLVTAGADENSAKDHGVVLRELHRIAKLTGALVIIIHHPGKDLKKGSRGIQVVPDNADAKIKITRGKIYVEKLRQYKDGQTYSFDIEEVLLGQDKDGKDVTAGVAVAGSQSSRNPSSGHSPVHNMANKGGNQGIILSIYDEWFIDQGPKIEGEDIEVWMPMDELKRRFSEQYRKKDGTEAPAYQKRRAIDDALQALDKNQQVEQMPKVEDGVEKHCFRPKYLSSKDT